MSSGEVREPTGAGGTEVPAGAPGAIERGPGEGTSDAARSGQSRGEGVPNMLPGRARRRLGVERLLVRLVATCGIVGIGVALGAILADNKVQGWIIGLVIAALSVVLSAILWSSRQV